MKVFHPKVLSTKILLCILSSVVGLAFAAQHGVNCHDHIHTVTVSTCVVEFKVSDPKWLSTLGRRPAACVYRDRRFLQMEDCLLFLFRRHHTCVIYLSTSLVTNDFTLSMPIVFIKDYFVVCADIQVWNVWWVIKQGIIRIICKLKQISMLGFTSEDLDGEDLKWVQPPVF